MELRENISENLGDKSFQETDEKSDDTKLKEVLEKMEFMPGEIISKYEEFVVKALEANPELLSNTETAANDAFIKIFNAEEKYNYSFGRSINKKVEGLYPWKEENFWLKKS